MHEHPVVVRRMRLWLDGLRLREFPLRGCDAAVAAVNAAIAVGVAGREGVVAGEGAAARRVREVAAVRPIQLPPWIVDEIMETKENS